MALYHRSYLFDSSGFRGKMDGLMVSMFRGDFSPLFEDACHVVERTPAEKFPFRSIGENLVDIQTESVTGKRWEKDIKLLLEDSGAIGQADLGYWVMLILSNYLVSAIGIGSDTIILQEALREMDWSKSEISLLLQGHPLPSLFSSSSIADNQPSVPIPWNYARPYNSRSAGWISLDEIHHLEQRLGDVKEMIQSNDHKRLQRLMRKLKMVSVDEKMNMMKIVSDAYDRALEMVENAAGTGKDLYILHSYQ